MNKDSVSVSVSVSAQNISTSAHQCPHQKAVHCMTYPRLLGKKALHLILSFSGARIAAIYRRQRNRKVNNFLCLPLSLHAIRGKNIPVFCFQVENVFNSESVFRTVGYAFMAINKYKCALIHHILTQPSSVLLPPTSRRVTACCAPWPLESVLFTVPGCMQNLSQLQMHFERPG